MNYYIIFKDRSILMIEQELGQALAAKKNLPDTVIDGARYAGSSMNMVLPQDKFFELYPDKRPETRNEFTIEDERFLNMSPEEISASNKRRQQGIMRGLKKFIDQQEAKGKVVLNARAIYERALTKGINKNEVVRSMQGQTSR